MQPRERSALARHCVYGTHLPGSGGGGGDGSTPHRTHSPEGGAGGGSPRRRQAPQDTVRACPQDMQTEQTDDRRWQRRLWQRLSNFLSAQFTNDISSGHVRWDAVVAPSPANPHIAYGFVQVCACVHMYWRVAVRAGAWTAQSDWVARCAPTRLR